MVKIKGFIFDMDGTITDTESISTNAWKKVYDTLNIPFDKDFFLKLKGTNINTTRKIFNKHYKGKLDFDELREYRDKYFFDYIYNNEIKILDGVIDMLNYLKSNNIKIALATSSNKDYCLYVLNKTKLNDYFDFKIFGNEIENGKPNPEIFIKAANGLCLSPKDCGIIEDSKFGISAAQKITSHVYGIPNAYAFTNYTAQKCEKTFSSMKELRIYIEKQSLI